MGAKPKVLVIHRSYRHRGGEDIFLSDILIPALKNSGFEFETLILPPLKISLSDLLEFLGMITGLERIRPSFSKCLLPLKKSYFSHAIFNNYLPTISLAVPQELKARGVKTLNWVHNFRLDCANGLHFDGKNTCIKCVDVGSRWSLLNNCQRSVAQSFLYALAYRKQRVARKIVPHIDRFICNSEFTRDTLMGTFKKLKFNGAFTVIPMPVPMRSLVETSQTNHLKAILEKIPSSFYLFLGRLSYEKGADKMIELAQKYPNKGFLVCGDGPLFKKLSKIKLPNLAFAGRVSAEEKPWLFKNCEALLIPSRTPETSSLVISESHAYGTPIVYPPGGGAEETFKILKRQGCAILDFHGQSFPRSTLPLNGPSKDAFGDNLKQLLWESP